MMEGHAKDGEYDIDKGGKHESDFYLNFACSIKRDIGHLCHDETTTRNASSSNAARRSSSISNNSTPTSKPLVNISPNQQGSNQPNAQPLPPSAIVNVLGGSTNAADPMLNGGSMTPIDVGSGLQQLPQMRMALQNEMMNSAIPSVTPNWAAASMLGGASFLGLGGGDLAGAGNGYSANGDAAGGNEYNILSEFLESLDGQNGMPSTPLPASNPMNQNQSLSSNLAGKRDEVDQNAVGSTDEGNTTNVSNTGTGVQATQALHRSRDRRASLADTSILVAGANKADTFFLTAADQKDGTRDERLGRVIQAKLDAGLLRPYNHVNGYARLNRWMEQNCSQSSRRRILKPISIFRPAFRAVAQRLTNVDLIFIEEAFERLLLDYDRVFSTQGIPACLWRRTGEIYKGNKEFADLVGVNFDELREGRCTIYELMQEESAVNYWEKYGAVCFDPGQKAVLTSCILRTNQKKKNIRSGTLSTSISNIATPVVGMTRTSSLTNQEAKLTSVRSDLAKESNATINKADQSNSMTEEGIEATKSSDSQDDYLSCCFSFTIRRDAWGIPYAIVGNFLPLDR